MSTLTDFRAVYFPYCIDRQANGTWVVLNRFYKPVGFNTSDFVAYEQFPVSAKLSGLGPAKLKKLSYSGVATGDRIYFYNDGCVPTHDAASMRAYLEKLKILASLSLSR